MLRLRLESISKSYPSVLANDQVDLEVAPGEIHAILGENGAGKSTLVKMIYGVTQPSSGKIFWEGTQTRIHSPAFARGLGIGMVFQHFSLFETLTVAENTLLSMPTGTDLAQLANKIHEISEHYGLPINPNRRVHELSVGEQQRVEIIRCLLQSPKLLIMDEPTSVLSPQSARKLFETLRAISQEGCSILYISHKLDEIQELCDTATILRAGRVTGNCIPSEESTASLAQMMIGKVLEPAAHSPAKANGEVRLCARNLCQPAESPFGTDLKDISFELREGEILGIAGVSGNGQHELLRVLSGETIASDSNAVELLSQPAGHLPPHARRKKGMCYVPEDRLGKGAVPSMSLIENALLTAADRLKLKNGPFLNFEKAGAFARQCIQDFRVKASNEHAAASSLSGGNVQKFIVGRELLQSPKVLICAQPTWGVDVGAAAFLRQALLDLRNEGVAVLVVSEELDELFEISDRIAVISEGRLSPIKPIGETNTEEIGLWMSGLWPNATETEHVQA
jgi:general nucleoside transport system ATP-binding protein